ncbi:Fc.00g059230.m01.CDS01 [Cosmosporella sp. VM-42]
MDESDQPRFELMEETIEGDRKTASSPHPTFDAAPPSLSSNSPPHQPLPSTEPSNMAVQTAAIPSKKKGTAATVKKAPRRPRNGPSKMTKKPKSQLSNDAHSTEEAASEEEESDHGPYCICRGPDDHRWMIFCENCEDWFHGECIHLDKDIGESLIEKFICPNCTDANLFTLYKKTCSLGGCRKPCRLNQAEPSVFCSNEHAQTWWERMVGRLPKTRGKGGFSDQLIQEEFTALLESGKAGLDEQGLWRLAKTPFSNKSPDGMQIDEMNSDEHLAQILSQEEKEFLDNAAKARFQLAEETLLCGKMLSLIELAQERRRAAITAGRFGEDICGYDQRLDTICARDAFAAYTKTPDGEATFKASKLSDPLGEGDEVRGMCEKKRCKVHSGWYKMLVLGIKHQIREMAGQAEEVGEEERVVREAAAERWKRKRAEKNWVEVLDG